MSTAVSSIAPARTFSLRQAALPVEHGGWSFLLEPMIAGLALAFSPGAVWIALTMIGAFLLRRPLSIYLAQRIAGRHNELRSVALKFCLGFGAVLIAAVIGMVNSVSAWALLPLAVLPPLAALQLYCDSLRQNRQVVPEISGAFAMSASVASMILAGGGTWQFAAAVWFFFAARLAGSILYVRNRLKLEKLKDHSILIPVLANFAGLFLVAVIVKYGLLPILTIPAFLILSMRSVIGLSKYRSRIKATRIGIWEVIFGVTALVALIVGHLSGL